MAAKISARPLYQEFLARVIKIDAVQRERAAVTEQHTTDFFELGRIPGVFGDFHWFLAEPAAFPGGPIPPAAPDNPVSLPMQRAWDAAVTAWRVFIALIVDSELIASGVHPVSGVRCDLDPVEWTRPGLILDVRDGDLYEVRQGRRTLRWSAIALRAAKQPRQRKSRRHGYDWEGAWAYATTLRAEDQWDWTKFPRDEKQPLPAIRKIVEDKIKQWFEAKGSVPDVSDIRRNIVIPLYAGRRTRRKRKR